MKFGKAYELTVQVGEENTAIVNGLPVSVRSGGVASNAVVVRYPQVDDLGKFSTDAGLTLTFSVSRNVMASANSARFKIINLSENLRRRIYKDRFDTLTYRQVILRAGYRNEPKLPEIFRGNILQAFSYRQKTDWVTEIECYSGLWDILNTQTAFNFSAGFNVKDAIVGILKGFKNTALGGVGDFSGDTSARGAVASGNAWDQVNALAARQDGRAFIDNEKAYVLREDEYIANPSGITVISSDSGLLDTPRRFDARLDVRMLFEPRIQMGQLIQLKSAFKVHNGYWFVGGVNHDGTISPAADSETTTVLNLLYTKSPKGVVSR